MDCQLLHFSNKKHTKNYTKSISNKLKDHHVNDRYRSPLVFDTICDFGICTCRDKEIADFFPANSMFVRKWRYAK